MRFLVLSCWSKKLTEMTRVGGGHEFFKKSRKSPKCAWTLSESSDFFWAVGVGEAEASLASGDLRRSELIDSVYEGIGSRMGAAMETLDTRSVAGGLVERRAPPCEEVVSRFDFSPAPGRPRRVWMV